MDGDKAYREDQKAKFLRGEIANPVLDYPLLDMEKLGNFEEELLALKGDVKREEHNEIVKQAYIWKINEKIAQIRMLRASKEGKMHQFKLYNEFIYGAPSKEVFDYSVQQLRQTTQEALKSENEELRKTAQELEDLLPSVPHVKIDGLPGDELIQLVKAQTQKELETLLNMDIPVQDKKFNAEEIKDLFQTALDNLKAEGWSEVIDTSSKTGISVDQESKRIKIPESRELAFEKIKPLIAHEVGTHIARRENGERSKLQLLGLGLDRYDLGEDGVATMKEQSLADKIDEFSGMEGLLSIWIRW